MSSLYWISGNFDGHFAAALQEQAVAQLHDVGLVDGHHLLAALAACPFEGGARDLRRGFLGDDLQALHHAGDDFVLQTGIEVLGILAEDREIEREVVEARLEAGEHAHRAEVRVEAELLAKRYIDALVTAADRGGGGSFEADARHFERSEDIVGNQLALFGERANAGFDALPFQGGAGGIYSTYGSVGNFGSNAVAGDECDQMGHVYSYYKVGGGLGPRLVFGTPPHGRYATSRAGYSRRAGSGGHAGNSARRVRPAGLPRGRVSRWPDPYRRGADHFTALHDRTDGRVSGTARYGACARGGRRLRVCRGRAGQRWQQR